MAGSNDTLPSTLGIIGLGLLGSAFADRALQAGMVVYGYDTEERCRFALATMGGMAEDSPRAVAQKCAHLLLALPHDGISREVLAEISPDLAPGFVILDATTGDAEKMAEVGKALATRDVTYLDATISGSSVQVRQGDALFMVGGDQAAFAACSPLLATLARQVIHVGPCGSGAQMKLVTNLVLGLNRAALAEGLVLAQSLGLDPAHALSVLQASMAYSRAMDTKGEKMVLGDYSVQARLSQHLKDVHLMLTAADRAGQQLPLSATHAKLLEFAEQQGLGAMDNSAVYEALRRLPHPAGGPS